MLNNFQEGQTVRFYDAITDRFLVGVINENLENQLNLSVKNALAKNYLVDKTDVVSIVDKNYVFKPIQEIEEIEEIEVEQPKKYMGLFAEGGMSDTQVMEGLPNELTLYIPLFDENGKPATDNEIQNRIDDVKSFLQNHFGEFVIQDLASSYIDREGKLVMQKNIQISSYPSDEEFLAHKNILINQISLWARDWGQEFMVLEFEDEMFYIFGLEDMMKEGGELWIQDAVSQMKKKGTIGAFTKQAKREGLEPIEFAKKVLKNPKGYTLKTRRRATFVKNVNPDKF
jgi:hypothetical protein